MQASCQCGSLTAEIQDGAEPVVVTCHCLDCQKRSGSPFGTMAYYPENFVNFAGDAREYSRPADSGNTFTTGFCATCGSTLYGKASGFSGIVGVTLGTIGEPQLLPVPTRSVYEQSKHRWVAMPPETQGFTRGRNSERTR